MWWAIGVMAALTLFVAGWGMHIERHGRSADARASCWIAYAMATVLFVITLVLIVIKLIIG